MAIYKIMKKNWTIVSFDKEKIFSSIQRAVEATKLEKEVDVEKIAKKVITNLENDFVWAIPNVIDVLNIVLKTLKENDLQAVAKTFSKYLKNKENKKVVVDVWESMNEYLNKLDWRINANANSGYSLWGMILNISWKVTANYWLSHIYPEKIGTLHRNWDYHIHDLDMFCGYCAGWSLRALLEEWFNWSDNRIDSAPAKNLQSAVNQMINFLWTLQNEWAWAQAFSSFDTYLAPFVHKFQKQTETELENLWVKFESEEKKAEYIYNKTYEYVYQQMQNFIFGLNVPSRWWTQTPFTNITLDWTCPEDLKDKALFLWWIENWYYEKKFWELEAQMKIINRALIEVYIKWDRKWRVFTLPAYEIPETARTAKWQPVINLIWLQKDEEVAAIMDITEEKGKYLFFVTNLWTVKKLEISEMKNIRSNWLKVLWVKDDDELTWVKTTTWNDSIFIATKDWKAIRFDENDVRPMGRTAFWVRWIKLKEWDNVIEVAVMQENDKYILTLTEKWYWKLSEVEEYKNQNRWGSGAKAMAITNKTWKMVWATILSEEDRESSDVILISKLWQTIRVNLKWIRNTSKVTQWVILTKLKEDWDQIVWASIVKESEIEEE